jgi:Pyruvate/2-oxoacid:ferredoxin oxidoreductase delta subunit
MCPDNAIIKLDPTPGELPERGMAGLRFAVNLEYCKGCGICAAECPCGAIDMVPEQT